MCLCVCLCVISIRVPPKNHIMCQTSVNLTPCCIHQGLSCTKVQRLDMCRSILLSKIASQMWRDHPFSQRDRKSSGSGAGDDRKVGGWGRWADEKRG